MAAAAAAARARLVETHPPAVQAMVAQEQTLTPRGLQPHQRVIRVTMLAVVQPQDMILIVRQALADRAAAEMPL